VSRGHDLRRPRRRRRRDRGDAEPCVGQIANEARRLRAERLQRHGVPGRTSAAAPDEEQVAPRSSRASSRARPRSPTRASITPLVALAGSDGDRCDGETDRWFVRAYREALAAHRRDDPTLASARLLRARGPCWRDRRRRRAGADRGLHGRDAADRRERCGRRGFRRRRRATSRSRSQRRLLARLERLEHGGGPRSLMPAGARPDVCAPLRAPLAPGASIAQPCARARHRAATLELHVTPAASERRVRVARGRDERDLAPPGAGGDVATALPDRRRDDPRSARRAADADRADRAPRGAGPTRVRAGFDARASGARSRRCSDAGAPRLDAATASAGGRPRRRVALADALSEARVATSNELSARVAARCSTTKDTSARRSSSIPGTVGRRRFAGACRPRRVRAV
jgi:hypothetical protein